MKVHISGHIEGNLIQLLQSEGSTQIIALYVSEVALAMKEKPSKEAKAGNAVSGLH